jgi:hypothetical protein
MRHGFFYGSSVAPPRNAKWDPHPRYDSGLQNNDPYPATLFLSPLRWNPVTTAALRKCCRSCQIDQDRRGALHYFGLTWPCHHLILREFE